MNRNAAVAASIIVLLVTILVYPQFMPHPPVIDERQLVKQRRPGPTPEPTPEAIPEPDIGSRPPSPPG